MAIDWIQGDYHTSMLRHAVNSPRDAAEEKAKVKAALAQRQQIADEVEKIQWVVRVRMPDGRDLYACQPPAYEWNDTKRDWEQEFTEDRSKALRFILGDFAEGSPLREARITLPACLGCLTEMILAGAVSITMERAED